jgi:integrase
LKINVEIIEKHRESQKVQQRRKKTMRESIGEGKKDFHGVSKIIDGGEMTEGSARRFLKAAGASDFHALFALALTSGMRPSEYLGLKWEDVDFDRGNLTVKRTVRWKTGGWEFGDTKILDRKRLVPLPQSTIRLLADHRRMQTEERIRRGAEYQNNDLVFADATGRPITIERLRRWHRAILRKAGLPLSIRVHELRYTRSAEKPGQKK